MKTKSRALIASWQGKQVLSGCLLRSVLYVRAAAWRNQDLFCSTLRATAQYRVRLIFADVSSEISTSRL